MQIIQNIAAFAFLAHFVSANYAPDKASQINFYTDEVCTQYDGEIAAWWSTSPYVANINTGSQPSCFELSWPNGTQSLNVVGEWFRNGTSYPITTPNAGCNFYTDNQCRNEGFGANANHCLNVIDDDTHLPFIYAACFGFES
ncbi:hypothetical protein B7494_g4674 [Chlorociboria aeruginascens]|nr:hypothetical protein B7494_g4674 [Chlorociboria aeruginascens]